jgi:hypothetical protein
MMEKQIFGGHISSSATNRNNTDDRRQEISTWEHIVTKRENDTAKHQSCRRFYTCCALV